MERKPVIRVIVHEDYKSVEQLQQDRPNSDLALVQFAGELPAGYAPTSWINVFTPTTDRFWLYVAGYGVSDLAQADSGELRFSKVTIENAILNKEQSFFQGNQSDGFGICKGDSGGPAYMKIQNEFYVIGVVSAIQGGCKGTSFLNQTLYYANWIQQSLTRLLIPN